MSLRPHLYSPPTLSGNSLVTPSTAKSQLGVASNLSGSTWVVRPSTNVVTLVGTPGAAGSKAITWTHTGYIGGSTAVIEYGDGSTDAYGGSAAKTYLVAGSKTATLWVDGQVVATGTATAPA